MSSDPIQVTLDGDGNAAVMVSGSSVPPDPMLEADLAATPFYSALTKSTSCRPRTPSRCCRYPSDEIITGNTTASGESDMYAVFYVEAPSVYAEQYVEIQANELVDRCGEGSYWVSNQGIRRPTAQSPEAARPGRPSSTTTATLSSGSSAPLVRPGRRPCWPNRSGPASELLHLIKILSPRNIVTIRQAGKIGQSRRCG